MKEKRNLLIGIFLGVIMGWALGFLRLPFLQTNNSFWLGAVAALVGIIIVVALLFVWNKNTFLLGLVGKKSTASDLQAIRQTHKMIWLVVFLVVFFGVLMSSWLIHKQNIMFERQAQHQNEKLEEQTKLMEVMIKNNALLLVSNFLDEVKYELKHNTEDSLSNKTIAKIAKFSASLKLYPSFEKDSSLTRKLSLERGLLLMALAELHLDSNSFNKIKQQTTFSNAYLKGENLTGIDLSGINLTDANMWGANLSQTNLDGALMTNVNLAWAELNDVSLKMAKLNGVNLSNATVTKTDLSGTNLRWSNLRAGMFNESNLSNCDLIGSNLLQANFNKANFNKANLLIAIVEENWMEKLKNWQVIDADTVQTYFKVVRDKSMVKELHTFHLEPQAK